MKKRGHVRLLNNLHRGLIAASVFVVGVAIAVGGSNEQTIASMDLRSITTSSSIIGSNASHAYSYTSSLPATVGSVRFEYCSNNPLIESVCVLPVGLNVSAVTLTAFTGDLGYSIHPNTALGTNAIILTRTASLSSAGLKTFGFSNITNPTVSGTVYVRISTYPTTDATGAYNDWAGVVYTVQNTLAVNVFVPPFIIMCHADTVALDCSSIGAPLVDLGELSSANPTTGTTQFTVATNSEFGYSASILGNTMTAGNRTIAALPLQTPSISGVAQFGINIVANGSPTVGANPVGAGTSVPRPQYGIPNQFRFVSGDTLASSPISTEWNRFTISYLVNIPSSQQSGRYASTISVIAATTF